MTDHERLLEIRALVSACDASTRIPTDWNDNETDAEHYLVPRGAWDSLVRTATKSRR